MNNVTSTMKKRDFNEIKDYEPMEVAKPHKACLFVLRPVTVVRRKIAKYILRFASSQCMTKLAHRLVGVPLVRLLCDDTTSYLLIERLIKTEYDINKADENGITPLHVAIEKFSSGHIAQQLIGKGANQEAQTNAGDTPLHIALKVHDLSSMQKLNITQRCLHFVDKKRNTVLHLAAKMSSEFFDPILTSLNGDFQNYQLTNEEMETPLEIALSSGNHENALKLLSNEAYKNKDDLKLKSSKECQSILQMAIEKGLSKIVVKLMDSPHMKDEMLADVDGANNSVLHLAAKQSPEFLSDILDAVTTEIKPLNNEAKTPYMIAITENKPENAVQLIKSGKYQQIDNLYDLYPDTRPIDHAISLGADKGADVVVAALIDEECRVKQDDKDKVGHKIFEAALRNKLKKETIIKLFKKGTNGPIVNMRSGSRNKDTVLHTLLKSNYHSKNALFLGLISEKVIKSRHIQELGVDGVTVGLTAVGTQCLSVIQYLIKIEKAKDYNLIDLEQVFPNGETILHKAIKIVDGDCKSELKQFISEKIKYSTNFNWNAKDENGETALHTAARLGDHEFAKMILNKIGSLSICDNDGNTAVHLAYINGHKQLGDFLMKNFNINCNIKNNDGKTITELSMET